MIKEKSFQFAIRVVNTHKFLISEKKEFELSKQLLRSGTSIGAMVREAEYAESKKDFIHKMNIAQKETNETLYWLDLLFSTEYLTSEQHQSLHSDCVEILKILTSIITTSKKNLQNDERS